MVDIFDLLRVESDDEYGFDDAECEAALAHLSGLLPPTELMDNQAKVTSTSLAGVAAATAASSPDRANDTITFSASELLAVLDAPQPSAPQPSAPQPSAPQPSAPQPSAPQPFAPQPSAPQPFALAAPIEHEPFGLSVPSRNALERKDWSADEDDIIRQGVAEYGRQWRRIAARLPGRSDDSVRNRWKRLHGRPEGTAAEVSEGTGVSGEVFEPRRSPDSIVSEVGGRFPLIRGAVLPPKLERRKSSTGDASETRPERLSWTTVEDDIIAASVAELGQKWSRIEQRLPGRTGHAIRNRWQRLLHMYEEGKGSEWREKAQPPPCKDAMAPLPPLEAFPAFPPPFDDAFEVAVSA